MHFSTNESLGDASANRTPRPHWKPAALTDGLISVYSPLSFSEVPWQHVYVLMGICIFLWLLPVTANQLKRSKSLNKYSRLFTEHREPSDGWVINVYLSDLSYGDFVWSHEGRLYLLSQELRGSSVRPEMRSTERYGWRQIVFEGFTFVCFLKGGEKQNAAFVCVCRALSESPLGLSWSSSGRTHSWSCELHYWFENYWPA